MTGARLTAARPPRGLRRRGPQPEFRVYPVGSHMEWHKDEALFVKPQYGAPPHPPPPHPRAPPGAVT